MVGGDGSGGLSRLSGVAGTSGTSGSTGSNGTSGVAGGDGGGGGSNTSGKSGTGGTTGSTGTSGLSAPGGTAGISGGSFTANDRVIYSTSSTTLKDSTFIYHDTTNSRLGIGAAADGNGRLYVYGTANTANFLSIANCIGTATTSSTGRTLAGYVRIYIAASVSNSGSSAFTAGNFYIAVYS